MKLTFDRCLPFKIVCLLGCLLLAGACSTASAEPVDVRVSGARDVLPLITAAQRGFLAATGLTIDGQPSSSALDDLQSGRADVVVLGREPTAEELKNAADVVIGYDAVCVLISTRTYTGGLHEARIVANLVQPFSKYVGLQQLSLADYRNLLNNILLENKAEGNEPWALPGSYFTFQPYTTETGALRTDPEYPNKVIGTWVWNAIPLQGEMLLPGRFDTQAVVLEKLGISPEALNKPDISFVPTQYGTEEEIISWRYKLDAAGNMTTTVSSHEFQFYLLPASRQVTIRALEHGFGLRALAIDGVDCVGDPQDIYTGRYPFSRKVHLLLKQPITPAAQALADWFLSPAGQQLVAQGRILPLP